MKNLSNVAIIDNDLNEVKELEKGLVAKGIVPCMVTVSDTEINFSIPDYMPYVVFSDIKVLDDYLPAVAHFDRIVDVLKAIIPNDHPYVFVSFSGTGWEDDLKKHLEDNLPDNKKPIEYVTTISKNDTIDQINQKIQPNINKAIYALLYWRRIVSKAAENTFHNLWIMSKKTPIESILKGLAIQSIGKDHVTGNEARAILEQMHALLIDTCNNDVIMDNDGQKIFTDAITKIPNLKEDDPVKSILNAMLVTDQSKLITKNVFPGDFREIYSGSMLSLFMKHIPGINNKKNTLLNLLKAQRLKKELLLGAYFEINNFSEELKIKTALDSIRAEFPEESRPIIDKKLLEIKNVKSDRKNALKSILKQSIFGIIDITAGCDFAQKKEGLHKIVLSYLVPKVQFLELKSSIPSSVVTKEIRFNDKDWILITDSKYLTGIQERDIIKNSNHLFRVRESSLNSIRQTVFFYNARIGTSAF